MRTIAIVMDTSTLLRCFSLLLSNKTLTSTGETESLYTPESVIKEVKKTTSKTLLMAISSRITVIAPNISTVKNVEEKALRFGVLKRLSRTDIDVIALAVDLSHRYEKVYIASEDYTIQNLGMHLGFEILAIGRKIRYIISNSKKCKNCGFEYSYDMERCPQCSSTEYIKVVKKRKI